MMLGLLLARAGIEVTVLEKHADFLRDFRGDTIHPSTLEVMHELGLLDDLLKLPHQEARHVSGVIGNFSLRVGDFSHLPTQCKFLALMPQWDFLDFLAQKARRYRSFDLRMQAEVTDLIEEGGRIAGVRATTPGGPLAVRGALTVGADGRHSLVRARAGFEVEDFGAPIDVLWMRLSRRPSDGAELFGRIGTGKIMVLLDRGDYWQCAFLIRKGGAEELKARGLEFFRGAIVELIPQFADRVAEIASWDDVKLLTVKVDRLRTWYRPGLLCIGDAAHAMSPVGGVGINLAIQDAVATANLLAAKLKAGTLRDSDLEAVRRRRLLAVKVIQGMQVAVHNRVLKPVVSGTGGTLKAPWVMKVLDGHPALRRWPAQLLGLGVRPEHVHSPEGSI